MGLVGRLEDLGLPDIFQIISLTKKTGKLTLTRREGTGVIIFRDGQIIYASSDSTRETLGNILVSQKLITESTLIAAMEVQHRSPTGKRLGTLLVDKGYLTEETLEKVIRLLGLLNALRSHPFLKGRIALKGGTALNLFVFDVPRLSVDIDLNYIGARDRDTMLAERPRFSGGRLSLPSSSAGGQNALGAGARMSPNETP